MNKMFNYAGLVSERIRNMSTEVETLVSDDVENEFSAIGGGDKTSERECISVDLPGGGLQLMRGDTGQGEQNTTQAARTDSVSRGEGYRGWIYNPVGDGRCAKPPLVEGPQSRPLLPLRTKLCPRRIGKVHPLDESTSSTATDAAYNTMLFPSIFLSGDQHTGSKPYHQTPANNERVGSVSTACAKTNLPLVDQEQTTLTTNDRSRKPWKERIRTFLMPKRQQKTTAMVSSNNTPESMDTPPKSFDKQNECRTRNQEGTFVSKQSSRDVEFKPAPPKEPNHRKGQATRRPMRCVAVVSGNNPTVATPTARGATFPAVDIPTKKPQGLPEDEDEIHTVVESTLHEILSPSFTVPKQLPPMRGIAKNEHLPSICLKGDIVSQSNACSSTKKSGKKCQTESSSGLINEPQTSPKHKSSKSKKQKTKRRKERGHKKEENKDAVAMVTSSTKTMLDGATKEQKHGLPEICLKRDTFFQTATFSSPKMNERKCQDLKKLSSSTYTKEQEDSPDCLPAICLRNDAFSTTVTSPPLKCQDVCPPSLNNGPSTSILPAIAYPKDNSSSLFKNNSSSQFKEQKTVRVRNDRLKTDVENKDTAASCGTSSPKRTSSSDDDIKEQKSSQGPDVSIYSFSLREQKNALDMDVKYVREHPYVQWEWLEMINSCRETAEDLNHQLTRGAKSARMITQGIAEEVYENAAIAAEKLNEFFDVKATPEPESDIKMSPSLSKKSPAKSSSSKAKKCRGKRHTKSSKKQHTVAEDSTGRSSRSKDHNKRCVDEIIGKYSRDISVATVAPECDVSVKSAKQKELAPLIVPSEFLRLNNGTPTVKAAETYKCEKLSSHRSEKGLSDMSSYPFVKAADLEHVVSWNGAKVVLGKGSTSIVSLMRSRSDGTLLAVKKMTSDRIRVTYDVDMLTEVTALRDVGNCPFLPKLLGLVDFRSFALELLGDGSPNSVQNFDKARFSSRNPLSCVEWLHVCRDVTVGLQALHNAGWTHNDLHAGNIVVCRNPAGSKVAWTGKIIDLGCARRIDQPILPKSLTYAEKQEVYKNATQVAPEVVEGLSGFTVKSDIYSLGRVFESTVAYEVESLSSVFRIGTACTSSDPAKRPKLRFVYRKLRTLCLRKTAEEKRSPSP